MIALLIVFSIMTGFGAGVLIGKSKGYSLHKLGLTQGQLLQIAYMIDHRAYRQRLFEWMDTDEAHSWADIINKAHPNTKAVPLQEQ